LGFHRGSGKDFKNVDKKIRWGFEFLGKMPCALGGGSQKGSKSLATGYSLDIRPISRPQI
jgi:hypothetical protein